MTKTENSITSQNDDLVRGMYSHGVHFGFIKSRRHPSFKSYIYGVKNKIEILDLEKTKESLETALKFIEDIASKGGKILFVSSKSEAKDAVQSVGQKLNMPYVAGRFIGGTITNFSQIRKRVEKLESLLSQKEKGELSKYTKKERLLIDREIEKLKNFFSGLSVMKSLPQAVFIIDGKKESIAVKEARKMSVPIIAVCGTDNNLNDVQFPIPANDASKSSIEFILNKVSETFQAGQLKKPVANSQI
jgi:small subunit ribosomal protein S2